MKQQITLPLFFLFCIGIFAQAPTGYYNDAQNLSGYTLKSALSTIISNGHTSQGYDALWSAYYDTDRDYYYENDATILDIYSENPSGADPYTYSVGNDQCGNYSGEGVCYNREHLMPQSWFNSASPMKSDVHHVYPTDGYVNGRRGHLPFGEVNNPNWTSQNGSKKGNNVYPNAYTGEVFEPIDEFKGDIARVYFYMATRYESQIGSWESENDGSQNTLDGSSDQVFEDWMLAMLLEWHFSDPVSQKELDRNNASYDFQGNRNPFIDNPQWAAEIWGEPDTEAPTAPTNLTADNITDTGVDLFWDAATDNVAVTSYQIEQDGAVIGTSVTTNFSVNNLTPENTYSFGVFALDAQNNISAASNSVSITTLEAPEIIFEEDFNDCNNIQFTAVSEMSDVDWECSIQYGQNDTGSYQMNAFESGQQVPSIDWLITNNPINFDAFTEEQLSFYTDASFGNTELQLLYSTDYDSNQMPSNAAWLPVPNVTIPLFPGGSEEEVYLFEDIDISSIQGDVYFAFKYDTSNGEQATRWTVDNFKIEGTEDLSVAQNKLEDLVIYPNPSSGYLQVKLSANNNFSYKIFDINGRLLQSAKAKTGQAISVEKLQAGLYLMQVSTEGKVATKKLVIQ
ncbi:endonuclease [Haloflavibacter putidus]|uniref:T9SS type A sorting domain-containing protein n=1 Tax=Haloflavibacter putidus TaxID=2576776 RepID=A0A507ZSD5_9FLAO|nr:endonuclease [Haloflavibacter putidus]TQD39461.1 T9SS type A sorting domain-containing protein [Haloflavibacter putidus]